MPYLACTVGYAEYDSQTESYNIQFNERSVISAASIIILLAHFPFP